MKINCLQLMQEIGYANKSQATRMLGESKDYITEAEARQILEKVGDTKMTSANKERVINAQKLLANKKYLEFTNKVEEKKVVKKASATKEPVKRTESEELEKYKDVVKKLLAENKKLKDQVISLKAENLALQLGQEIAEKESL